jgi:predicted metalloendopeptidase
MINEIIKAFKIRIKAHSWMDNKTRHGVDQKVCKNLLTYAGFL